MISLAWPFMLALLPVPLLAWLLLPRAQRQQEGALRVPFFAALAGAGLAPAGRPPWLWLRLAVLSVIWTLLVVAAARPVLLGLPVALPVEGRDLMLVLDASSKMMASDVPREGPGTSRLEVAKGELEAFIATRGGDRLGMTVFSSEPFLLVPLTLDRKVLNELMLETSATGTSDPLATDSAVGDAIALGVKGLRQHPAEQRVMVLVVGSMSNAGSLAPSLAAEIARSEGVRIHAIGLASERYGMGEQPETAVPVLLDAGALRVVAETTGGKFFRARTAAEMRTALAEIGKLEPPPGVPDAFTPVTALFFWPLGAAVLLSLLFAAVLLLPDVARAPASEPHALPEPAGGEP